MSSRGSRGGDKSSRSDAAANKERRKDKEKEAEGEKDKDTAVKKDKKEIEDRKEKKEKKEKDRELRRSSAGGDEKEERKQKGGHNTVDALKRESARSSSRRSSSSGTPPTASPPPTDKQTEALNKAMATILSEVTSLQKPPAGAEQLRERRVTRIQALVRRRQAQKKAGELWKEHKARTSIVTEILTTERTYVDILRQIVELFITPLREAPTPLVSSKDIRAIFLTNELLHTCHATMLAQLELRYAQWSASQAVGDIFLQLLQFLGVYTSYAVFYSQAIHRLNECKKASKGFSEFLEDALKKVVLPKGKVVDLPSLLITPVQRIMRYSLLFMDLLKHTPIDHLDYNNLSEAFSQIKNAVAAIEASTEEVESLEQMRYIQENLLGKKAALLPPYAARRWIRDGDLKVVSARKNGKLKRRFLILCNDALLLTEKEEKKDKEEKKEKKKDKEKDGRESPEKGIGNKQHCAFKVRKVLKLDKTLIKDGRLRPESTTSPTNSPRDEPKYTIELWDPELGRRALIAFDSMEARQSWLNDILTAIEIFQSKSHEDERAASL